MEPAAITDEATAVEGRLFGRYLVGREPPPALVARYAAACRTLLPGPVPEDEVAVLAFAHRHPWSIGAIDAASGVLRPGGAVRSRILLMAALLETTPDFADDFLPRDVGPMALAFRVAVAGATAVLLAALGSVLVLGLGRRAA